MTLSHADQAANNDGSRDFDFWIGRWKIRNKRLVKRLVGSKDWETFDAIGHARTLPAGIGNYDDFVPVDWRPGFVGMSLRLFSRQSHQWSIYWLDNVAAGLDSDTGCLTPPVVGRFKDGIGVFVGPDLYEGKPIIVKYVWSEISPSTARWHQEFSGDDGRTWETNWIMEHSRLPD
jgi:hypothetical protein